MSITSQTPPSASLAAASSSCIRQRSRSSAASFTPPLPLFKSHRIFPQIRASFGSSSSLDTGFITELDVVSGFSEIVPDTIDYDDFERFPYGCYSQFSLLPGICGLPETIFRNAVDMALGDSECLALASSDARLSCFFNKALVNVGGNLAKLVPGRVSTEVDACLAYDTHGIIRKVHDLLKLYQRLLFKIPSTWQGIKAANLLESEGIQTHLTFVYRTGHRIIQETER